MSAVRKATIYVLIFEAAQAIQDSNQLLRIEGSSRLTNDASDGSDAGALSAMQEGLSLVNDASESSDAAAFSAMQARLATEVQEAELNPDAYRKRIKEEEAESRDLLRQIASASVQQDVYEKEAKKTHKRMEALAKALASNRVETQDIKQSAQNQSPIKSAESPQAAIASKLAGEVEQRASIRSPIKSAEAPTTVFTSNGFTVDHANDKVLADALTEIKSLDDPVPDSKTCKYKYRLVQKMRLGDETACGGGACEFERLQDAQDFCDIIQGCAGVAVQGTRYSPRMRILSGGFDIDTIADSSYIKVCDRKSA